MPLLGDSMNPPTLRLFPARHPTAATTAPPPAFVVPPGVWDALALAPGLAAVRRAVDAEARGRRAAAEDVVAGQREHGVGAVALGGRERDRADRPRRQG